jgi:hypothetical protein
MVITMTKLSYKTLSAAFTCLLLSACASMVDKHVQWETVKPDSFPVITAVGYAPISLQRSSHETQRMLMAIKASKLAAYAELAEQVNGQQVNGELSMADLVVNNHELNASVRGIIRGAKVMKSYPVGDIYTTELSLDFKDVYDIYKAHKHEKTIKKVRYY